MVLDEERECPVCFAEYSRSERVPRVLHCGHTCCSACVERMSSLSSTICAVRCPLCRWISCAPTCLPLPGALLVNTDIWDQIAAREEEMCETEEEELTKETLNVSAHSAFTEVFKRRNFLSCVLPQRDHTEPRQVSS